MTFFQVFPGLVRFVGGMILRYVESHAPDCPKVHPSLGSAVVSGKQKHWGVVEYYRGGRREDWGCLWDLSAVTQDMLERSQYYGLDTYWFHTSDIEDGDTVNDGSLVNFHPLQGRRAGYIEGGFYNFEEHRVCLQTAISPQILQNNENFGCTCARCMTNRNGAFMKDSDMRLKIEGICKIVGIDVL